MTLEGILVPRRWSASGKVAALALNTLDEREVLIESVGLETRELMKHLRKRVLVTGELVGNRMVRVTAVKVQDSLGEPEHPSAEGERV